MELKKACKTHILKAYISKYSD